MAIDTLSRDLAAADQFFCLFFFDMQKGCQSIEIVFFVLHLPDFRNSGYAARRLRAAELIVHLLQAESKLADRLWPGEREKDSSNIGVVISR